VPAFRRSNWVFLYRHDGSFVDVARLLAGEVIVAPVEQTLALSLLTGEESVLSDAELELLFAIPSSRWSDAVPGGSDGRLDRLVRLGLVLSDDPDSERAELLRLDERLVADHWHPYAALYHFMTRWRDVDVERLPDWMPQAPDPALTDDELERSLGPAPAPFADRGSSRDLHRLPLPPMRRRLFTTLARRKTSRTFDRHASVTLEQLGTALYLTFGCRGTAALSGGLVALKKTSPSGGGLHPIEAYPLVARVDGVDPGLYHYDPEAHGLRTIEQLSRSAARRVARELTAGQSYFADAHVLVVLAARFRRSYWKYRHHQRAYAVMLMDAGHLSQTFSLVCTELGLGAFVTAAVNDANAEERLGLDSAQEGVLAVVGCGVRSATPTDLEPEFVPLRRRSR
jgi:putative peptide maturation dehydrogenase